MALYDNEFKQREMKFKPRIKLNHNRYNTTLFFGSTGVVLMSCKVNFHVVTISFAEVNAST